jgi:hypothetical protein
LFGGCTGCLSSCSFASPASSRWRRWGGGAPNRGRGRGAPNRGRGRGAPNRGGGGPTTTADVKVFEIRRFIFIGIILHRRTDFLLRVFISGGLQILFCISGIGGFILLIGVAICRRF